ncbi:MAG TPA: calcium-binding protein [Acetobacteraceae bacterium]|jgi:Ca2+-binding RTX toxin-like protein
MSLTIEGTYTSGITLTATTDNPVSITGTIAVADGYALGAYGGYGQSWTIDNAGVLLSADSKVINLGSLAGPVAYGVVTNEASGTIAGSTYGIAINGPGAVTNMAGGTISAVASQGIFFYGPGTVANAGVIGAGNVGVYLAAGGSVTNTATGTIFGAGGVWMQQPGTVINAGTITGTNAGFGAVAFEAYTYQNRLIVDPGAQFNGNVSGGGGVLELAVGSGGTGTLTGLGGSVTNFTTLQFDPHADWTVAGNAIGLDGVIEGFNPLVTIDLTGFAAVSETFAYNVLTLSDGAGNYASLQIQGNFDSSNFQVTGDGNGGALVSETLVAGTYNWIAANADWTMPGDWDHGSVPGATDTAVIANPGGNTVTIAAAETVAIGNVMLGADTLEIAGTLVPGGTLSINGGVVELTATGLIDGGTLADPNGNGVAFSGGTLMGVTYQGSLEVASTNALLVVASSLTVTDATGTMPGTVDLTGGGTTIEFVGNQVFDNATINLNSGDVSAPDSAIGIGGGNGSTLTLGPNAVINSDAPSVQASIGSRGAAQTALVNQGTIIADASGGSFVIDPADGFTNAGTLIAGTGDTLSIQPGSGMFDNSGLVSVQAGATLRLLGAVDGALALDNTGTIALDAGATLDLAGSFTVPMLGDLLNAGATIEIDGTLDGQGSTLTLGNGTTLGNVVLNGEIENAVIQPNDALSIGSGATLLNDTYAGPIALDSNAVTLTIHEGVTLTDATGLLPGAISVVGQHDTLAFANVLTAASAGQTLANVAIDIGNAQGADVIAPAFNGGTFVIGADASIESTTTGALVNLTAGTGTDVVLDGTLSAIAHGGMFGISGSAQAAFVNNGQIFVGNGDTLGIGIPGSGTGTLDIATHGVVASTAAIAAGETIMFTDATGMLRLSQPGSFGAAIDGFAAGDTIDLAGVTATSATWAPGELTLHDGGTILGTLAIAGDYSTVGFAVSGDGAGGSDVAIGPLAPQLTGVPAAQTVPLESSETLFATVQVTDGDITNVDTATVALSVPSAGALENLGSGSYDTNTGVYTVAGTASTLTTAIDGLSFVPANAANGLVSTVAFSLSVEGPGGSSSVSTTSLTQVPQFLWLAGGPSNQVALASSQTGQSFPGPVANHTNEAVVTAPSPSGSYTLPDGYQAEFLGGSANATLTDNAVGNALLVGNSGNDSIVAGAGNDSLVGGSGNNMLIGGSGTIAISVGGGNNMISALIADSFTISTGNGNNTVAASGAGSVSAGTGSNLLFGGDGATLVSAGANATVAGLGGAMQVQASGPGALVFGDFIGSASSLGATIGGGQATVSAGNSPALVALTGGSALVFGGFTSQAGSLSINDSGYNDTVSAGNSNTTVTLSGSNGLVFGGFGSVAGTLQVLDAGSGDTVATGNSAATISAGGNPLLVFGGGGPLNFVGGAGTATISGEAGATTVSGGSGSMVVFGGSGPLTFNAGSGSAVVVAGSGDAMLTAGPGNTSMAGGTGDDLFSFINGQGGGEDLIWQFVHGQDQVHLAGYAPSIVQTVLAGAVSSGGSTTVTLPDNTMITFAGLAQMTASDFI